MMERQVGRNLAAFQGPLTERIGAARRVKNDVVGNPTNKRLYISNGVVPELIAAANVVDMHPQLAAQAVSALGSLACLFSPETISLVGPALLCCLFSAESEPVNAAARALKLLVLSDSFRASPLSSALVAEVVATRIVSLLSSLDEGIAEVCVVIIAQTCTGKAEADVFEKVAAIPALVHLLWRTNHERCVEACLVALSELARFSAAILKSLADAHALIAIVTPLTRSPTHSLRLAACRLLTIFHSADLLPSGLESIVSAALVNLLDAPDHMTKITTAITLSELVAGSVELQSVATDSDAVRKLSCMVSEDFLDAAEAANGGSSGNYMHVDERKQLCENGALRSSAFTALSAIANDFDPARDAIISRGLLPEILAALSEEYDSIVQAALKCILSLGRSVKIVRRDLSSHRMGVILLDLVSSDNQETQRCASAALCNLVLEFSPVRQVILRDGGLFARLLHSQDDELRINALWVLKNLLFKANGTAKRDIMSKLGYERLQSLCGDYHPRVRELSMTVVRNLACSGSVDAKNDEVDALFDATGDGLVTILSEALKIETADVSIAVQALYAVCNIASGTERHKERVMKSDIPKLILQWTSHQDERARIAAVWCTINLSWKDRSPLSQPPVSSPHQLGNPTVHANPNRLEMLRRQRLPIPSSMMDRRYLETAVFSQRSSSLAVVEEVDGTTDSIRNLSSEKAFNPIPQNLLCNDSSRALTAGDSPSDELDNNFGYEWRIGRLRELGFEGRLRMLVNDPHVEVQGRARAALELFDCEDVRPLDCDPAALLDHSPTSMQTSQSPRSPPDLLSGTGSDSSLAGSS